MTPEIALAYAILIGALIIFALDLFPIDFVAFGMMALILVLGPVLGVAPEEAISGFSNPATITVLAMFILSGAVYRTGVINLLTHRLVRFAGNNEIRQLLTVMLIIGPLSAFINNTAAVAILIPSIITLAREHKRAPSRLLIPLSYFSQLAGVITLIGTSTNILASALSMQEGYGAFGMFEFSAIGLMIFVTGALYILLIGRKLLPERRDEPEIADAYQVKDYLSEVIVLENSPLVGVSVNRSRLREQFDIHVFEVLRNGQKLAHPLGQKMLQAGDILFIKANTSQLLKIKDIEGLAIEPEVRLEDQSLQSDRRGLMEVVIGPNSDLIGGTVATTNFRQHYSCTVIAIRKHGELIRERLANVRLGFGDTLLLRGSKVALEQIKREPGFIATEEVQQERFRTSKIPIVLAIVAGVVIIAALGVPILVTAVVGCVLMVLTGCLKVNELHESVRWDVIFLLAGVIPLGLALERTGGAQLIADLAANASAYVPPLFVLSIFYLAATILTELISNNATVVVLVPMGVATGQALGLDPRAFILAIMFAASTSFSTPVGYQTNTMVYGPGGYKFLDFIKVGLPLNLLLVMVTPIFISLLWGL
ncbi:MAG: SLC13 family permease [Anaerolineae bacterium]|nr:SLC13 family permease [Anaerolineae bacterium]